MASDPEPRIERILETVLYCRSNTRKDMIRFYDEVLGLRSRRIGKASYRFGSSVLLIFNADRSAVQKSPPPHGSSGPAHICFLVPQSGYEHWKDRIRAARVEILEEIEWTSPLPARSLYFHDPAGNVLEIADRDMWPQPAANHG